MSTLDELLRQRKALDEKIEKEKRRASVGEITDATAQILSAPFCTKEWKSLINSVTSAVNETAKNGYTGEDDMQYIGEAAMEAVYGAGMFTWYNKLSQ